MKISKSKQELARIISENGGWRDGAEWAAQDSKIDQFPFRLCFYQNRPTIEKGDTRWIDGNYRPIVGSVDASRQIKNWHQTILSREEYFHLYPAPDADGWIECGVGGIPVGFGTLVDVKLRGGNVELGQQFTSSDSWGNHGGALDIIAYRLHKPEQAKPEFCESVMRSIPEPEINSKNINITQVDDIDVVESKPTIEQLAADYRSAKDYAERKQQEVDAAKADAEARLKALELAGEAIGLLVTPITTKKEPELVITDWLDLQIGDVIKCVGDSWGGLFRDSEAVVEGLERHDYEYDLRICASIGDRTDWGEHFIFIRRP